MPTGAKLVAAIALALAAFGVSGVVSFRFEVLEHQGGVSGGLFALIGGIIGWMRLGPAADISYGRAWATGVGGAFATYFIIVLAASTHYVYRGLGFHAYKDVDALVNGFFKKTFEYAMYIFDWQVLAATIVGGLLAGIFAGFAGRLWT